MPPPVMDLGREVTNSHPLFLTWASHTANNVLMGRQTLLNQSAVQFSVLHIQAHQKSNYHCCYFCLNHQAQCLTGRPVTSVDEARAAILSLLKLGCTSVVLTLREAGAVVASQHRPDPVYIPTRSVNTVDLSVSGPPPYSIKQSICS